MSLVYLHGYWTSLAAEQARVRASGVEALVPKVPTTGSEPVYTPAAPKGYEQATVVAYSGGYRTLASWLEHGARPAKIILVDTLYTNAMGPVQRAAEAGIPVTLVDGPETRKNGDILAQRVRVERIDPGLSHEQLGLEPGRWLQLGGGNGGMAVVVGLAAVAAFLFFWR